jgi:hypothetical protein
VDLRGYDPAEPLPVTEALAGFIRALGWAGRNLPTEAAERAALYRSLLSGRRALVLLDNARSAEQVRPLLPGTPGCAAVVTSRDALSGLVARDGAQRLELDVLPAADAAALLRSLIGARAQADPGAVRRLSAQCAWLPLALRVAAELAAASPRASLVGLVRELADPSARLDRLDAGGDGRTAIRTVLSWSCRQLDGATARVPAARPSSGRRIRRACRGGPHRLRRRASPPGAGHPRAWLPDPACQRRPPWHA